MTFDDILKSMSEIHTAKNSDYGNNFTKTMDEFGEISAVIRLSDKLNRLKGLIQHTDQAKVNESIDDTLIDLANYAVMTVEWRKSKEK